MVGCQAAYLMEIRETRPRCGVCSSNLETPACRGVGQRLQFPWLNLYYWLFFWKLMLIVLLHLKPIIFFTSRTLASDVNDESYDVITFDDVGTLSCHRLTDLGEPHGKRRVCAFMAVWFRWVMVLFQTLVNCKLLHLNQSNPLLCHASPFS